MKGFLRCIPLAVIVVGLSCSSALSQEEASSGEVVHYTKLALFLPDTLGIMKKDGEPHGSTLQFGDMATTEVSQAYSDGDNHGSVSITSAGNLTDAGMLEGMFMDFAYDSPEGYQRSLKMQGFRTLVAYDKIDQQATLIIYAGKFVINLEAYGTDDAEWLIETAREMDLASLAQLDE